MATNNSAMMWHEVGQSDVENNVRDNAYRCWLSSDVVALAWSQDVEQFMPMPWSLPQTTWSWEVRVRGATGLLSSVAARPAGAVIATLQEAQCLAELFGRAIVSAP